MRTWLLPFVLLHGACARGPPPQRGVLLEYVVSASARETVERRLARAQLAARVSEEEHLLTLRLAESTEPSEVKALLGFAGSFELCAEQLDDERHWCGLSLPAGVERQPRGDGCVLTGALEATLRAAIPPPIGRPVLTGTPGAFTLLSAADCVRPRLVAGEVRDTSLALTWDSASAAKVSALTSSLVAKRTRLLVVGPEVLALEVRDPLTGTHLSLPMPADSERTRQLALAALLGGPLPSMTLQRESTWGPPTLR